MLADILSIVNFGLIVMICTTVYFLHRKRNADDK